MKKREYNNLRNRRGQQQLKYILQQLVRTADNKRVFTKGDSTKRSYKLCTVNEVIHNSIPSYRNNNLSEKYNENILLATKLPLEQNNRIMTKLNLIQKYNEE